MAKSTSKPLPPELRLGAVAVRMGFLTQAQLEEAIAFQERRGMQEYLGSILLMLDYLTPKTLAQVLAEQKRQIEKASKVESLPTTPAAQGRFGEIAVGLGILSASQLEDAIKVQQSHSPKPFLGAVLMDLGYLTPEDIPRVLATQFSAAGGAPVPSPAKVREKLAEASARPPSAAVKLSDKAGRPASPAPAPKRPASPPPARPDAPPKPAAPVAPAALLSGDDLQLGHIAVRLGYMTQSELEEALDVQKRRSPRPFLGSLLVELNYLTSKTLAQTLAEQVTLLAKASKVQSVPKGRAEETRFGNIAVNNQFITQAQLDEALDIQGRSSPKPFLGAVLVDLGYLSPRQLSHVLAAQAGGVGFTG